MKADRPVWLGEDQRGWDHARIHRAVLEDERLGAYEIAVYVGLAIHAESRSGAARPAAATLAAYANMGERRVRTALDTLEQAGWIDVEQRPGMASVYRLLPPPTPARGADVPDRPLHDVPDHPGTTDRTSPARGADGREPGDENQGTRTTLFGDVPADEQPAGDPFDSFWREYPRRVAKQAAVRAWAKAIKVAHPSVIITGAARYATETAGRPTDKIAHPASWLNDRRWEDEPGVNATRQQQPQRGARAPVDQDRNAPAGRITL